MLSHLRDTPYLLAQSENFRVCVYGLVSAVKCFVIVIKYIFKF